jgi:tyrosine-protein kinase Etk/Wzc
MNTTPTPPGYSDYNQIPQAGDESVDIRRYISLFIGNWYWFAFALFISISIAYGINRYSEQTFSVSSTLLIKDEKIGGGFQSYNTLLSGNDIFKNQQNLKNEIGILKSFSLNYRVLDSLRDFHIAYVSVGRRNIVETRLYKSDCPFEVITDSFDSQPKGVKIYIRIISVKQYSLKINGDYEIDTLLEFGQKFKKKDFSFIINQRPIGQFGENDKSLNKYYFYFEWPQTLANSYSGKLSVEPIDKDASLVRLSVSGFVPEQETDYLNKLMDYYILQGIEVKNRIADSTIKFIDKQLKAISAELVKAEENLKNFKHTNRLISVGNEVTIIQNRLVQFGNEKITLELQQKYYEYLINYLNNKNESGDIISPSTMGVTDQQLGSLVKELAGLQNQKKQLSMNLSGNQAPVALLEEGITNARSALSENVKNSLDVVKNSILNVNDRIKLVEQEISKLPETEIKMINIQRTFDLNNTIYTFLLEKRAEAGIAKASNVSDNRIIDIAEPFNSVLIKPKAKRNILLALFFGLLVPGLFISIIYNFNNKIIDKEDILRRTHAPIIGYISHNDTKNEIPVNEKPGSALSESFRSVRTSLRYFIKDTKSPVIAVTSTISSEGKTFISINLAAITAMLGKKVLLVGLDLRKPRIHRIFDINNDKGLSNYLIGDCEYDKVIHATPIVNLFYATSGPVPPNPAELIESEKMKAFIEKAKKEFDMIIIDTPPVAIVSDALLLAVYVDVNVFVIRQRYSSRNTLDLVEEYYQAGKLKNIGIVMNDISLSGYYGYGLRYGYSMGYGYYYGNNYYGEYSHKRYGYSDDTHEYYNN